MSGIERGYVEILVHTSAPSRGQDDTRYRALAQAYLDFEPASRAALDGLPEYAVENEQTYSEVQAEPESQASYRPDGEVASVASPIASSENAYLNQTSLSQALDSTDLSFNSVLDNANSPICRERLVTRPHLSSSKDMQTETQHSTDLWQPPPSTVADSQPENNINLAAYSSPTRVLELYLQQMESSKDDPSPDMRLANRDEESTELASANMQIKSSIELEATGRSVASSGLPSPIRHQSAEVKSRGPGIRDQDISYSQDPQDMLKRKHSALSTDPVHTSPSSLAKRSTNVRGDTSSHAARSKIAQRIETPSTEGIAKSKDNASTPAPTQSSSVSSSYRTSYASVLQVRAPPPATSMSDLTLDMLRTASLDQLARKMPLHILYRPQSQTRELRAMERGYWLVTCTAWNEELRARTWDCLGNFIAKGQAGWGVWCVREEDFGAIRVYCWGAIVGYIYLLLYMASESKVKGTAASFMGGDGKAIITMPS